LGLLNNLGIFFSLIAAFGSFEDLFLAANLQVALRVTKGDYIELKKVCKSLAAGFGV
jgi:hypothetical protein